MPLASRAIPVALALVLGACGTVQVLTDDPRGQIYVDGRYMGRGEVRIRRIGPPRTARILVKAEDGRRATATMRREMTLLTGLLAFPTYGICLAVCWEYPGAFYVRLPTHTESGGWDSADSPWLRPPAGWEEPVPGPPEAPRAPDGNAPSSSSPAPQAPQPTEPARPAAPGR